MIKHAKSMSGAREAIDLYDYAPGQPSGRERRRNRFHTKAIDSPDVSDDLPDRIPVSVTELDIMEAYFAAFLDDLFRSVR
jgi:hypothetical protein